MTARDFEHEGPLTDAAARGRADRANSRARQIVSADLLELTESEVFLRWFGRYAHPALVQNFPVSNGSALAHFMGKRELVLQVVEEMDGSSPGFLRRLFEVRAAYEKDLLLAANKES